jgi:nucleoside-diphosphate-sugar epimerase
MELITGATGFIGSHLAQRLLDSGRKVRVLCRPESLTAI